MNSIPYEIAIHILLYVDKFATIRKVASTSKWFNAVCKQNKHRLIANLLVKKYKNSFDISIATKKYGNDVQLWKIITSLVPNTLDTVNNLLNYDTFMYMQALYGHLNVVKFLVTQGADLHAMKDDLLIECTSKEMIQYLLDCGATVHESTVHSFCSKGDLELVKLFVEHGVDIDMNRLMLKAIMRHHNDIVEYLADLGVRIP